MPEITARLRADQIVARKAADKDRTLLLGTVLASLKNRELELGHEPTDVETVEVLRKQIKQRLDSFDQYTKAARPELAAREDAGLPDPSNRNYRKSDLSIVAALAAAAGFNAVTVFAFYVLPHPLRSTSSRPHCL